MTTRSIKAGKAVVELSLADQLDRGLIAARKKLTAFADGLKTFGSRLLAGSAGVLAGLGGFALAADSIAGPLQDLADASGVTAAELSALQFAGDTAGVSLDNIAAGLKTSAKFSAAVAANNKGAIDTLQKLGIAAGDFLAATPAQRLGLVADGLQRINDPGLRAALAMKVLGKAGFDLQRLLAGGSAGLEGLLARAGELGTVLADKDVAAVAAFGDSLAELAAQGRALAFEIGRSLVDLFGELLAVAKPLAATVLEFVRNNRFLVAGLATLAAIGAAVGAALYATGVALSGLVGLAVAAGAAVAALPGLWAGLAAAVAALLSPLGLVAVGVAAVAGLLVAGAAYWALYTTAGQAAVAGLVHALGLLGQTAGLALAGIFDAATAGNWELVGRIITTGIAVGWTAGVLVLQTAWATFVAGVKTAFLTAMIFVAEAAATTARQIEAQLGPLLARLGVPLPNAGKLIGAAAGGLRSARQNVADDLATSNAKAGEPLTKMATELARLRGLAARERATVAERQRLKLPQLAGLPELGRVDGNANAGTLGTFSGFVAGLIGRSAPTDHAKRTADGVEKSNELLAAMRDELGGLGLEAE